MTAELREADHVGKRALVIAHEPFDTAGQIGVRLRARGFEIDTAVMTPDPSVPEGPPVWPSEPLSADLLLVMGSERSLTDTSAYESWLLDEIELIHTFEETARPILGVCFGGQLLAKIHGGSVERSSVMEIGFHRIEPTDGSPVGEGPWMQWHHDRFSLPPHAELLAWNEAGPQMFQVGSMVGTQFHPEVDHDHVARWIAGVSKEYLAEFGLSSDDLLDDLIHNEARNIEQCHALVDWFLDEVAFPS
ncbi:MAG: type 1 glutamine amidotransferase [Acidimicrobiales bacterium]